MMICPGCGEAIADDLNFCPSCGMELDSLSCPSCGAKNNKKSKYCRACGKSLNYAMARLIMAKVGLKVRLKENLELRREFRDLLKGILEVLMS